MARVQKASETLELELQVGVSQSADSELRLRYSLVLD